MPYPAKKPFKKFSKFSRPASGGAGFKQGTSRPAYGKPFGSKPAWGAKPRTKKSYGDKPAWASKASGKPFGARPSFGASRSATRIGESAPRRTGGFGARPAMSGKPAWASKGGGRKDSNQKWKRPYVASGPRAMPFRKPEQKNETSWGKVAGWYHDTVESSGSYQRELILPNILRLADIKKEEVVLDLACGEGFFSRAFEKAGAKVIGVDIAPELIAIAKKQTPTIDFRIASADKISFINKETIDKAVIILALQNIESLGSTMAQCARVIKKNGKLFIVLNHPAFRIPQASSWGFDPSAGSGQGDEKGVQYRRVDSYISESRIEIQMHPGENPKEKTISFHRPLQLYVKALKKAGFVIAGLEEWTSHKMSEPGPRAEAENKARKEFPMFLMLEAVKL